MAFRHDLAWMEKGIAPDSLTRRGEEACGPTHVHHESGWGGWHLLSDAQWDASGLQSKSCDDDLFDVQNDGVRLLTSCWTSRVDYFSILRIVVAGQKGTLVHGSRALVGAIVRCDEL